MFDAKKLLDALITSASENTKDLRDNAGELADRVRNGEGNDVLRDFGGKARGVFGQATEGVKDAAGDIGDATGISREKFDEVFSEFSGGRSAGELLDQAKDWAGKNQGAAGAIVAGLGALIIGTKTGRSLATGAAKIGGAALIGGLAYKAYQNYQQGRPLIDVAGDTPEAAPDGSGFEADADTNEDALRQVRAMISAAAADGHIDQEERDKIIVGIRDSGLDPEAYQFLENEFHNPASIEALTDGLSSEAAAAKIYTAARVTIEPESPAERDFLESLAIRLALPTDLIQHIDAEVATTRAI